MNLFLMPSPNEIFSHPVRWAMKHLAFYAAAAMVAGVIFVAGAGVYSYLGLPAVERINPAPPLPAEPVKNAPSGPTTDSDTGALVASAPQDIPFQSTLGAKVVDRRTRIWAGSRGCRLAPAA